MTSQGFLSLESNLAYNNENSSNKINKLDQETTEFSHKFNTIQKINCPDCGTERE